ncbi:MAG: T9SS type A sorting domain-containing protein [Paludibacteraceae bacterium]
MSRGAGLTPGSFNYAYVSTTSLSADKSTAIANNEYSQIAVAPKSGYKASLSTLKYKFRCVSSGPLNYRWAYSVDGGTNFTEMNDADAVSFVTSIGAEYQIDLSGIAALQNLTSSALLRMYVWGATSNAAVFGFGRYLTASSTLAAPINSVYLRGVAEILTTTSTESLFSNGGYKFISSKTNDDVTLMINSNVAREMMLSVITIDGKQVYSSNNQLIQGENNIQMKLKKGTYIVSLMEKGGTKHNVKFIK